MASGMKFIITNQPEKCIVPRKGIFLVREYRASVLCHMYIIVASTENEAIHKIAAMQYWDEDKQLKAERYDWNLYRFARTGAQPSQSYTREHWMAQDENNVCASWSPRSWVVTTE